MYITAPPMHRTGIKLVCAIDKVVGSSTAKSKNG